MADKIIVPTLGESIKEATVAKWLKKLGDSVGADEAIVSLETDKVSVDVTSPKSGVLKEILAEEGSTVQVGGLLGSVEVGASVVPIKKEEKKFQKLNKMQNPHLK